MIWNHRDHPRLIRLPTLTRLYCASWLERLLLVAKRAVHRHGLASAHTPHHTTPWGERASLLPPFPILLFCLPFSRLRLFIQELKVKVYLPRSHRVSMALSIHPILPSITLPLYHLPSPPASAGEGGKNSWYLWCFAEKRGTEWHRTVSQPISVHDSCTLMCLRETEVQREKSNGVRGGVQWLIRA